MKKLLLLAIIAFGGYFACQHFSPAKGAPTEKADLLTGFRSIIAEADSNYAHYTDADWQEADGRYDALVAGIDGLHQTMSEDELTEVRHLKGQYKAIKLKSKASEALEQAKGFFQHAVNL